MSPKGHEEYFSTTAFERQRKRSSDLRLLVVRASGVCHMGCTPHIGGLSTDFMKVSTDPACPADSYLAIPSRISHKIRPAVQDAPSPHATPAVGSDVARPVTPRRPWESCRADSPRPLPSSAPTPLRAPAPSWLPSGPAEDPSSADSARLRHTRRPQFGFTNDLPDRQPFRYVTGACRPAGHVRPSPSSLPPFLFLSLPLCFFHSFFAAPVSAA